MFLRNIKLMIVVTDRGRSGGDYLDSKHGNKSKTL